MWVKISEMIMYSCYSSPNISGEVFDDYVQNLGVDIRRKGNTKIILKGDFNSKSPMCGSAVEDNRGYRLSAMLHTLDLLAMNDRGTLMFVRGETGSVIDVTAITRNLAESIVEWRVLDEEYSYSSRYVLFDVKSSSKVKQMLWVYGQIDERRLGEELTKRNNSRKLYMRDINGPHQRYEPRTVRSHTGRITKSLSLGEK